MKKIIIYFLFIVLSSAASAQTKLYEKATGDNLEAYKHEDKFTPWQKLNSIDSPYVYYRGKICTTIANSKTHAVAHPFATLEVKAPENINSDTLTGFINIVGKKTLVADGSFTSVPDTTQQFFDVSATDPVFSVDVTLNYSEVNNVYVTFFTNDSEDTKEKALDKKLKPANERIQKKINSEKTSPIEKAKEKIKKKSPTSGMGNRG